MNRNPSPPQRQQGFSLLASLILLVVVTLVALAEGNFPAAGCANGYCAEPAPADQARWTDAAFNDWFDVAAAVSGNAITPGAIVERNGEGENWLACGQEIPRQPNCRTPRYRVTSRSVADDRASVILQSDVATQ